MNQKIKELGKNTTIFAVSLFLSKLVSSLLVPLYTRTLTTEQYGIADLVTTISHFIVPICSLSIHESVFRFCLDSKNDKNQIIRCGIIISWVASIVMIIVGFMTRIYAPIAQWSVYLILISIMTMSRNILSLYTEAIGKVMLFGIDSIVCNFVLGVANIVLLAGFSLEVHGYFCAMIISLASSILLLLLKTRVSLLPHFEQRDLKTIKLMLSYSAPLILNSISWILMGMIDRLMLTSMYSSGANGIYAVATKIPTLLTILTSVFTQAWGLSLVKDYDFEKDERFYNNVFDIFHLIALLGTNCILLFTNNIFKMIIGNEFSDSVQYIAVLMIGTVFLTYINFYSPVYSAAKKPSRIAISSLVGLVLNILLNVVLIPQHGIMGACIATTGSYILICIYRMIDCKKYVSLDFSKAKWITSMILIIIQCVFVTVHKYDLIVSIATIITICIFYFEQLKRLCTFVLNHIGKMSDKRR